MEKLLTNKKHEEVKEEKKVNKLANKLQKKYTKKHNVNEKVLTRSLAARIISATTSIICCVVALFALLFCISSFNCSLQKVVPTFAGFGFMRVSSGSMVNSGFNVGDTVVVKAVDTFTVKPNDVIAFYTYSKSYYDVKKKIWFWFKLMKLMLQNRG